MADRPPDPVLGQPGADPILYLPAGPSGDGFLLLGLADGSVLPVPLTATKARLLAALAEAQREDGALVWAARGWRRPERLARMVAGDAYPVEAQTIRAYLSQIKRSIRAAAQAAGKGLPPPALLEHRRTIGVRVGCERFQVIDGTRGVAPGGGT
jgi:hypothetical protein